MGLRVDFGISEFEGMWIGGEVRWGRRCVDRRRGVVGLRNESTGKGNSPWVCIWCSMKSGWSSDYREGEDWCEWLSSVIELPWGRGLVWVTTRCEWVRWSPLSLFLSLFLSLCIWDPEMVCSENRNVNQFPGQSHKTHGQLKCFSRKFYFPCATKHTVRCKIISWNGFTPKQTHP